MKKFEGFQHGVNLGGWISQFAEYDTKHFDTFITETDIARIRDMGFDHVRVPVDYNVLEDEEGVIIERGFTYLESCRKWCEKYGLNMVIDLHECFGYSFDPLKKDMDRKKFFYDDALQKRFLKLWKEIAVRFASYTKQVAFEPLNEVVLYEVADAWNLLLGKYIAMIREIAPDAYIIVGGVCYNNVQTVALLDIPVDEKVVYNFHCYEPLTFTHQGATWTERINPENRISYSECGCNTDFFEKEFAPALEAAKNNNTIIYCGEYGVIDRVPIDDILSWYRDIHTVFEKYGIGRCTWNYKEKDFGISDKRLDSIRNELLKYL